MRCYFFFLQGMKSESFEPRSGRAARDSLAITRLFNEVESKKNKQKNVSLLFHHSLCKWR